MRFYQFLLQICLSFILLNCSTNNSPVNDEINVQILNSEVYEYKTGISGDEEGASIKKQAQHFEISDIFRNSETGWEAVYRYKPESNFIGFDYVELEIKTGSDGASPSSKIELIKITIEVVGT